jgi:hypothetical protein
MEKREESHSMRDVFQAAFLRKSKGPEEALFIDKVDEGRLVFLFCMDYFVEHSHLRRSCASSRRLGRTFRYLFDTFPEMCSL